MPIQKLTKSQFDAFKPARGPLVGKAIIEKEWYAAAEGNVIGTLTLDKTDNDWGYVVLGRDQKGQYRGIDFKVSISAQADARTQLHAKLEEYGKSDDKIFPQ